MNRLNYTAVLSIAGSGSSDTGAVGSVALNVPGREERVLHTRPRMAAAEYPFSVWNHPVKVQSELSDQLPGTFIPLPDVVERILRHCGRWDRPIHCSIHIAALSSPHRRKAIPYQSVRIRVATARAGCGCWSQAST